MSHQIRDAARKRGQDGRMTFPADAQHAGQRMRVIRGWRGAATPGEGFIVDRWWRSAGAVKLGQDSSLRIDRQPAGIRGPPSGSQQAPDSVPTSAAAQGCGVAFGRHGVAKLRRVRGQTSHGLLFRRLPDLGNDQAMVHPDPDREASERHGDHAEDHPQTLIAWKLHCFRRLPSDLEDRTRPCGLSAHCAPRCARLLARIVAASQHKGTLPRRHGQSSRLAGCDTIEGDGAPVPTTTSLPAGPLRRSKGHVRRCSDSSTW